MRHSALALCSIIAATPAHALRCGSNIVSEGDSAMILLRNCGEPAQVEEFVDRTPFSTYDQVRKQYYTEYSEQSYQVWTYNFGSRRLMQQITVKGGTVKSIKSMGYGY